MGGGAIVKAKTGDAIFFYRQILGAEHHEYNYYRCTAIGQGTSFTVFKPTMT